jgi:hypothetical protein
MISQPILFRYPDPGIFLLAKYFSPDDDDDTDIPEDAEDGESARALLFTGF